jgi:hypothetical protein
MYLHEELGVVPKDAEADVCDEDAPIGSFHDRSTAVNMTDLGFNENLT